MAFESLRIARFRNIDESELELGAGHIFLLGDNGQGKTNCLKALDVHSYGSSFRTRQDRELPLHGCDEFFLRAAWSGTQAAETGTETVSVRYSLSSGKDIRINDKPVSDRKELVAHHPSVVFCHEDMAFAAGVPEERRFFFDQCAGMLWLDYIDVLRSYRRVLRHRNAALKMSQLEVLDSLDIQMARFGLELLRYRARLAALFAASFPEMYEKVSLLGSEIGIEYRPSWPHQADLDMIIALLARQRARDVEMKTSMSGPHRDRWVFTREGRDFSAYASTGQLRLASLLLRIVQA
ncbi:MAG: DNA replication and repair protein RecF, partial [Rectinema sp.]|nr:DNA replication and repair protein RecF [Rectinema sp.]